MIFHSNLYVLCTENVSRKKSSFLSGRATKSGGGQTGVPLRKKRTFCGFPKLNIRSIQLLIERSFRRSMPKVPINLILSLKQKTKNVRSYHYIPYSLLFYSQIKKNFYEYDHNIFISVYNTTRNNQIYVYIRL